MPTSRLSHQARGEDPQEREGEERGISSVTTGSVAQRQHCCGVFLTSERRGAADCTPSPKRMSQGHLTHRKLRVMTSTPGLEPPAEASTLANDMGRGATFNHSC